MAKKSTIQAIKEKQMDRKEFLKYGGLALAALVGFRAIVSIFLQDDNQKVKGESQKNTSKGYGGGRYGA